jgi:hypothetical protein
MAGTATIHGVTPQQSLPPDTDGKLDSDCNLRDLEQERKAFRPRELLTSHAQAPRPRQGCRSIHQGGHGNHPRRNAAAIATSRRTKGFTAF